MFKQVKIYSKQSSSLSAFKSFWTILNNQHVTGTIENSNGRYKASLIMCFDFSTLSTNNPHRKLIRVLNKHIDFQGGDECFTVLNRFRVQWNNRHKAG